MTFHMLSLLLSRFQFQILSHVTDVRILRLLNSFSKLCSRCQNSPQEFFSNPSLSLFTCHLRHVCHFSASYSWAVFLMSEFSSRTLSTFCKTLSVSLLPSPLLEMFCQMDLASLFYLYLLSLSLSYYILSFSFIFCKTLSVSLLPSPLLEMFCQMDLASLFYLYLLSLSLSNYILSLSFIFCKTPPLSLLPSPSLEMFCQMDLSSLFYLHLLWFSETDFFLPLKSIYLVVISC